MEMYQVSWHKAVDGKAKLNNYALIKNQVSPEPYIRANLTKNKRSLIARLRLGCLPLRIETGRYDRLPHESRVCKMSDSAIEDEIHFLIVCENLRDARLSLYSKIPELLNLLRNIDRLELLNNMPYTFGNYIDEIWQIRARKLESV